MANDVKVRTSVEIPIMEIRSLIRKHAQIKYGFEPHSIEFHINDCTLSKQHVLISREDKVEPK